MMTLFRTSSFHLGLALLAAAATAQKTPDVRLDAGSPAGASGSHEVQLATTGNFVYAVWLDERNGNADVYLNRSADGGLSWLPQEVRLDTGAGPGAARSTECQIAADGPLVGVVWTEDSGSSHVFFNCSLDGGLSWLPAPRQMDVGGPPGSTAQMPTIACNLTFFYVAWSESRSSFDPDIYFDSSLDRGVSWQPSTVRLDTGSPAGTVGGSFSPRIAGSVPNVCVVWDDFRSASPGIYCNGSTDLGVTWFASDLALNSVVSPNGPASGLPQVAVTGNSVYVCWTDNRFGGADLFCQASNDGGITWLPTEARVDVGNAPGAFRNGQATLAASGQSVHVAWRDARNHANNGDIYYNHSLDGGQTWGASDQRLDVGSPLGASDSMGPLLAAAGDAVAAVWVDNRFGSYDILCNTSADRGNTWMGIDARVDTGVGGLTSDSMRPALASNGVSFFAAWEDLRSGGREDIYANLVAGYQVDGAGTMGATLPALAGTTAPVLGGSATIMLSNGLGNAPGLLVLGVGSASRVAVPFFGGTLLVNPAKSLFFVLDPAGTAALPLAVPARASLLGLNLNLQGLLLDSAAAQGMAMSNGLAFWIG